MDKKSAPSKSYCKTTGNHSPHGYSKYFRHYNSKPRQEISKILKYLIFFVNFIFVLCGITFVGLGIYIYANEFRPIMEVVDFFLNPAILLIAGGLIVLSVALLGSLGALRDNVCMLKMFSLCLFFCYISLVVIAFMIFILFYSDTSTGISIHSLLLAAVKKYHLNDNYRDFMDYLQVQLKCCGASSQGYKDWAKNAQYNCSADNRLPERCGVPYSCCVKSEDQFLSSNDNHAKLLSAESSEKSQFSSEFIARPPVIVTSSQNPSQCWRNAQRHSLIDVQNRVYTDGCLSPLQKAFEGHAVIIGAVIGAIIIPVLQAAHLNLAPLEEVRSRERSRLGREKRQKHRRHSCDLEAQVQVSPQRKASAPAIIDLSSPSPQKQRKRSKKRSQNKKHMRKSKTEPILYDGAAMPSAPPAEERLGNLPAGKIDFLSKIEDSPARVEGADGSPLAAISENREISRPRLSVD